MIFLIFLLPVITSIILLCFFRKQIDLWEYIILFIGTWLILGITYGIMKSCNCSDTEYLGYYVTKTTYYERWNERQRRTRTVTTGTGKNRVTRTEVYYVTVNHPERWEITLNNKHTHDISKKEYNRLCDKFGTSKQFRDMHRHYYTVDGDAYDVFYPISNRRRLEPWVKDAYYTNKIKGSKSVFNFVKITDDDKETYKLYDYPKICNHYQPSVLGYNFTKDEIQYIDVLNSLYGQSKEFRLYMLFFKDMPPSAAVYQKSYWEGGNKNELVLCIGYSNNKITWCEGFSWCDDPVIEAECKMYFIQHPELNTNTLKEFSKFIEPKIKNQWVRKNFEDFNYLTIELSQTQLWVCFIIAVIINILISMFIIGNNYNLSLKENNNGF